jgi:hypothetical protein
MSQLVGWVNSAEWYSNGLRGPNGPLENWVQVGARDKESNTGTIGASSMSCYKRKEDYIRLHYVMYLAAACMKGDGMMNLVLHVLQQCALHK